MNVVRRSATGALAALAIVLAGPALAANAAHKPYHFHTLASISGAQVQACRIPTSASKPVTIKLRVDARTRVRTGERARAAPPTTEHRWARAGHRAGSTRATSRAWARVHVARGAAYALDAGIGTGAMGNGGSFKTASIRTCH